MKTDKCLQIWIFRPPPFFFPPVINFPRKSAEVGVIDGATASRRHSPQISMIEICHFLIMLIFLIVFIDKI